ncbi:MAG TPA: hypothetical protein VIK95_03380 [Egibacteraceae bacterium]
MAALGDDADDVQADGGVAVAQQRRPAGPVTAGPGSPAPWLVVVLGIVGFAAGVVVLLIGAGPESSAFRATLGFKAWAATIGAQTAYWAIVAGPLWRDVATAWRRAQAGRLAAVVVAVALLVAVVCVALSSPVVRWPLEGHRWKILLLTAVGSVLVAVPALAGVALVHERVRHRSAAPIDSSSVVVLLEARAEALRFLSVAGGVIGLAVLATGALRHATVEGGFVAGGDFPPEAVLLYGAVFTGLLAFVYVPAHLALQGLARRVRDHHFPLQDMPVPDSPDAPAWLERRARFGDLLAVDAPPLRQLEASLFIVAPLLSAILSHLIPGG